MSGQWRSQWSAQFTILVGEATQLGYKKHGIIKIYGKNKVLQKKMKENLFQLL